MIGGIAAGVQGAVWVTVDLDIVYARERDDLAKLSSALDELGAAPVDFPGSLRVHLDARALAAGSTWTLWTKYGRLDLLDRPRRAILTRGRVLQTFGGNPVAMAAALAVLEVMDDERIIERAAGAGEYLAGRLREVAAREPLIGEVRGIGLAIVRPGIIEPDAAMTREIVEGMRQNGVLIDHRPPQQHAQDPPTTGVPPRARGQVGRGAQAGRPRHELHLACGDANAWGWTTCLTPTGLGGTVRRLRPAGSASTARHSPKRTVKERADARPTLRPCIAGFGIRQTPSSLPRLP